MRTGRSISRWHLLITIPIVSFYLVSVAGWILSINLATKGILGKEVQGIIVGLTPFDHFVRVAQVLAIAIASVMLLCLMPRAASLFKYLALASVLTTVLALSGIKPQWSISFIGGLDSMVLLAFVYVYVAWLSRTIRTKRAPNQAL